MLSRPKVRTVSLQAALFAMVVAAHAQTTVVPEQPAAPGQVKSFDSQHLTQRPYDASLPKPIFPSTPREQKEFTVRYIYDYAESTYSPPAALPTVTKLQFDRSTPEGAMTAFVSTMQEGDYDGWLQCWDEESRKAFTDAAKTGKQDAAYWKKVWQTAVAGRTITLDYRLELVGYVILDARMAMPGKPPSELFPTVFKNVSGKWLATTGLGTSIFLGDWRPGVAGIDNRVTPQPLAGATGGWVQQAEAQQQFLKQHATRSEVVQAAQ